MIYYTPASERTLSLFKTPFDQSLSPENRWVKMAELVPWDEMAKVFFSSLSSNMGRPTVDLRIVLGALLVKHLENLTDEDTIPYIQENIYAQYFVGLSSFQIEPVFVPSLFVEIRKRLGKEGAAKLNDLVINQARTLKVVKHRRRPGDGKPPGDPPQSPEKEQAADQENPVDQKPEEPNNRGTLMVDATVSPVNIAYPTDTRLLAEARLKSEALIDALFESARDLWPKKPRTYRRKARQNYVSFSKKRRKDKKSVRKATGQQLRYVRRNLKTIKGMLDKLEDAEKSIPWTATQWKHLWVIQELYRQQEIMYRDKRRQIDNRLVSIDKPMVRPIKRGKGGTKNTEFGPKINASMSEGIARVDQIDFNAFNEAKYLKDQIEAYKSIYGYYPAEVLADQIYWTRENRKYLKDRGIKHNGPAVGRKKKQSKSERNKARKRNNKRSEIEGKFGQAKIRYGLDKIQAKLSQTIPAEVHLIFLAMNLLKVHLSGVSLPFLFFAQAIYRACDKIWKEILDQINDCYALLSQHPAWGRKRTPVTLTF